MLHMFDAFLKDIVSSLKFVKLEAEYLLGFVVSPAT